MAGTGRKLSKKRRVTAAGFFGREGSVYRVHLGPDGLMNHISWR